MSKNVVTWNPGPRSLKVIESGTIRQIAYSFIVVFYSNFYSTYKYTVTLKTGRLWNDLYCDEWDVKLYYTIPYLETRVTSHIENDTI